MFEIWEQLSIGKRLGIISLVCLLSFLLVFFTLLFPTIRKNQEIEQRLNQIQSERDELVQVLEGKRQVPDVGEDFDERYQQTVKMVSAMIPRGLSQLDLNRELLTIADNLKLKFTLKNKDRNEVDLDKLEDRYALLPLKPDDRLYSMDVGLVFNSSYGQMLQLFEQINSSKQFLVVKSMEINREVPKMNVELTLRAYYIQKSRMPIEGGG